MKMRTGGAGTGGGCGLFRFAITLLAAGMCGASTLIAEPTGNTPDARFHGGPTYDLAVTNVQWEAATRDYSYVTFDLSWSFSWRARWTESATNNVTGAPLEIENWDAAWVFVKFLPEKDSKKSIERNEWRHAMLDADASHHVMPAGATNSVGLTDDRSTGLGVFIHRDSIGFGRNEFKGVKLRWLHGAGLSTSLKAGKFDPAKADVRVHAIAMVYVPGGAFKVGSGSATRIDRFPDGPTLPILQGHVGDELGSFTDGSWRGGPIVPFLVDADWNAPAVEGTRARRIGAVAGQLWGRVGYTTHCSQYWVMPYSCSIGAPGTLNDDYPTGYDSFYCMKYELTQGQYVAFLNSLPREVAADRAHVPGGEIRAEDWKDRPWENGGYTITLPGRLKMLTVPDKPADKELDIDGGDDLSDDDLVGELTAAIDASEAPEVNVPPVYEARVPYRTCNFLSWQDGYVYAAWAGLRPMTELEFEKVCRGPLNPVPNEHAWGSTAMIAATNLQDSGLATEHYDNGNSHLLFWRSPPETQATRVGIFATPDSDRVAAGASYWGVMEMEISTFTVPAATTNGRAFRGSHGDGRAPVGKMPCPSIPTDWPEPGGRMGLLMSHRTAANIPSDRPPTYPRSGGGRSHCSCWRGVRSAPDVGTGPAPAAADGIPASSASPRPGVEAQPATPPSDVAHDNIRIANVKWEAGTKQYSHVTFDISWDNSWRTVWTEPADGNVSGKPMKIESWDAAWVFVKVLPGKDTKKGGVQQAWRHATLDADASHHSAPDGATVSVGFNNDGSEGVGVFVYRAAAGRGANDFKGIRLRWLHGGDEVDPARVELAVHAIAMVYVPEGPFKTKGPWGHQLAMISTPETTKTGGYRVGQAPAVHESQKKKRLDAGSAPKSDAWPNGYRAFYCMKYAITQGQFAEFLNSSPDGKFSAPYNINRFTIRRDADKGYRADVPDRACNELNWRQIWAYTAWAGLRPITDLEYEKACRGPREVVKNADAWADAACRPAAELGKAAGPGASYWGIRELSLTGIPFEWPHTIRNEPGFDFKGTHGEGTSAPPPDWPAEGPLGDIYEDEYGWGMLIGAWMAPPDMGRVQEVWGHLGGGSHRPLRRACGTHGAD